MCDCECVFFILSSSSSTSLSLASVSLPSWYTMFTDLLLLHHEPRRKQPLTLWLWLEWALCLSGTHKPSSFQDEKQEEHCLAMLLSCRHSHGKTNTSLILAMCLWSMPLSPWKSNALSHYRFLSFPSSWCVFVSVFLGSLSSQVLNPTPPHPQQLHCFPILVKASETLFIYHGSALLNFLWCDCSAVLHNCLCPSFCIAPSIFSLF